MVTDVESSPVYLATRHGRERAYLISADQRIAAILVAISPEDNESETEGWYLEVGFGPCEAEGLLFASLTAAKDWVRGQMASSPDTSQRVRPFTDASNKVSGNPLKERSALPQRLRLLIVEDDGVQALGLQSYVQDLGHTVVQMVATAPAAVKAADEYRPDLILMDVRLADGTNGIEAAAEIQRRFGILSLFMTAHADVQTRARAAQVRSVELLAKPVSLADLSAALERSTKLFPGSPWTP